MKLDHKTKTETIDSSSISHLPAQFKRTYDSKIQIFLSYIFSATKQKNPIKILQIQTNSKNKP